MSRPDNNTAAWEWAGIVAAMIIVFSLPAYYMFHVRKASDAPVIKQEFKFVGSVECRDCHNPEFDSWEGSHHDLAMDVANEQTVLGDFDDAEFTLHGITSRFYRKDDKYFVHTNGPGGEMGDFEITHTFGWYPLQQYLVPFPGGRLQTLHMAWDSRDHKWFRVPPEGPIAPDDWLYWTNAAQNWNGMCAQCHSTHLEKNFNPETDTYNTTWSDIDVGCEACHGPGSSHVEWAELPEMARPETENFQLAMRTSNISSRDQVELCAPCHSRRSAMGDYQHMETDLLDNFMPSLLTDGLYFADGQIHDEVYVYGSFTQSKMYRHDVRCSDCHDVHSIERVSEGNELCLQCHRAAQYDTAEHHFHKQEGEAGDPILSADGELLFDVGSGAECEQCHMPGRYYMGVDYRPDHSFRVPDPALNEAIGAPDACLRCHQDKDSRWSQQTMLEWYGPGQSSHYGMIIAQGRASEPDAETDLIRLAGDLLYPVNVRATALELLAAYPSEKTLQTLEVALMDEEALIRRTAASIIDMPDREKLARLLGNTLFDPVKTVRTEAARRLAGDLKPLLDSDQKALFELVLGELEATLLYSADFATTRHNLANLYADQGRLEDAIGQYQQAIRIDDQFIPAKVNLAMLYNQSGQNEQAEKLLKEALKAQPDLYNLSYSLGLLLVEMQQYGEAVSYLEKASRGLPERARIHYNLGLLYQHMGADVSAEAKLKEALALEPGNLNFLFGLADHFLKRGRFEEARPLVEQMVTMFPEEPVGEQMLQVIRQNTGR